MHAEDELGAVATQHLAERLAQWRGLAGEHVFSGLDEGHLAAQAACIISSAKTDEREFKITLRSGHARPIKAVIEDQVPASETAEIQVELLPLTTPPTERNVEMR